MTQAKKNLSVTTIVVGILIFIVLWTGISYNGLVSSDEDTNSAFANVETQLQRRFDLIPNLQSIVEGAAEFERSTFVAVTEARTKWLNAGTNDEKIAAANQTESALARLLLTFENYPQLKATQGFRDFQVQLEGTENRIAVERKRYNETATKYNKKIRTIPTSILANMFEFDRHELFTAVDGAEDAPKIDFSFE